MFDTGAVEGYQPGDTEAQVNTNQPVPQPHDVRMSDVDVKGVRGSQPIGENQVDAIFRSASGSAGGMIRASRNPLSGTAQEPIAVEEILRPGDDFRPGSDVSTVTDAKQIRRKSSNHTPSDEMDSEIDNGNSDDGEPVYCYDEPKETETVLDASQEDIGAETVPCYGRSPTLQKKVNELSFLIHYHSVDKMVKIFDEGLYQKYWTKTFEKSLTTRVYPNHTS